MQAEGAGFQNPSDWEPMLRALEAVLVLNYLVGLTSKKILYQPALILELGCQNRILNVSLLPERITGAYTKNVVN